MNRLILGAVLVTASATLALGDEPLLAQPRPEHVAEGPLQALEYFLGDWEIEATWAWGATLHARNEYRVGLNGNFVEVTTIVRDNDGPAYERYFSFYTGHKGDYKAVGLAYDGSFSELPYTLETAGDSIIITTDSTTDGTRLRQRFETQGDNSYTWKAWMTAPGADAEQLIMDGVWHRISGDQSGADDDAWSSSGATRHDSPYEINPALFAAAGADLRSVTTTTTIGAPPADVFGAWTSAAGWKAVYDTPESKANIDLAIGGRYEWLFDGALGSNGCQVLSYIPDRMISFTWNAPPTQPESRRMRTWVVVELDPNDRGGTDVTLTHLGFGDAEHWDETEGYFQNAWPRVLAAMQDHFEGAD